MGFFGRLATLIKSNLNDLISKSEDPEKMLNQIILDMNAQLIEAKKQVAIAIADEKKLHRQWQNEASVVEEWHKKAMLAVRAGDDALAKEALARKKEHEQLAKAYEDQWNKQNAAVNQVKLALQALNAKIGEAKRKKDVLVARNNRAKAMQEIQRTMGSLQDTSAFDAFSRMEQKIDQVESEAEAAGELHEEFTGDVLRNRFAKLEQTAGADADLEELKRSMGVLPPKEEPVAPARVAPEVSEEEMAELEEALEELKKRELSAKG
jgi:phage shock protein A